MPRWCVYLYIYYGQHHTIEQRTNNIVCTTLDFRLRLIYAERLTFARSSSSSSSSSFVRQIQQVNDVDDDDFSVSLFLSLALTVNPKRLYHHMYYCSIRTIVFGIIVFINCQHSFLNYLLKWKMGTILYKRNIFWEVNERNRAHSIHIH